MPKPTEVQIDAIQNELERIFTDFITQRISHFEVLKKGVSSRRFKAAYAFDLLVGRTGNSPKCQKICQGIRY